MNLSELPSAETILKFVRGGQAAAIAVNAVIEKNGVPVDRGLSQSAAPLAGDALRVEPTRAPLNSQWMDITPELAGRWLKNNFRNRPVKADVVAAYARDMVAGLWRPTHQGVAFNDRDELIDGQHRLLAIVKAGVTVRMMVTFGLPAKTEGSEMTVMDCVDRGATRSVADQLKIQHGLANGGHIAKICAVLAHLCFGERVRKLGVGQTLEIYSAFQFHVDDVIAMRSPHRGLRSAGVAGAFAFVLAVSPAAREMYQCLMTGEFAGKFPAVQKLREFLTGPDAAMLIQTLNKGVAEMTAHVLWQELTGAGQPHLETEPRQWLQAVEHFRALQRARVDKISGLLKLPAPVKVEPVAETTSATRPTPAQPAASEVANPRISASISASIAAAPMAAGKGRPPLGKIIGQVEHATKISWFIISGRGKDPEIDSARVIFIHVARSYGHTAGTVAAALKRTEEQILDYTLPLPALTAKQKKAGEQIRAKL